MFAAATRNVNRAMCCRMLISRARYVVGAFGYVMWSERSAVSLRFKMQSDVVEGPFCVPFCPGADSPRAFCLTYDHV